MYSERTGGGRMVKPTQRFEKINQPDKHGHAYEARQMCRHHLLRTYTKFSGKGGC